MTRGLTKKHHWSPPHLAGRRILPNPGQNDGFIGPIAIPPGLSSTKDRPPGKFVGNLWEIPWENMGNPIRSHIQRRASVQWWWEQRSRRGRDSHSFWSAGCAGFGRRWSRLAEFSSSFPHWNGKQTWFSQFLGFLFKTQFPSSFPRQMICILQIILGFPHLNALDGQQKWRETAPGVPRYVTFKCWVSMGLMLPSSSNFWTSHFTSYQNKSEQIVKHL